MSSRTLQIGDLFLGRYQIEGSLGEGGFASVFLARQVDLDRHVALKILRPGKIGDEPSIEASARHENFAKRFEREAKLISRLRDPRTVVMHDYGRTEDGLLYMVLEYIDGLTCAQLVKGGALPPGRVVAILEQVLRSLREAHAIGILHRDIKPQNIMLFDHMGDVDQVKVLDFGIAKPITTQSASRPESQAETELTGTDGMLVGTPRYMSPEQIRGDDLTPASDIYSLGLVAYELLMGVKAVTEPTTVRIISRHLSGDPIEIAPDAPVPPRLRGIIDRMLRKRVSERYPDAQSVLDELERWQEPLDISSSLEPLAAGASGDKRTPIMIGGAVLVVLLFAAITVLLLRESNSSPPATNGASSMTVAAGDPLAGAEVPDTGHRGQTVGTLDTEPVIRDAPDSGPTPAESADAGTVDAAQVESKEVEPKPKTEPRKKPSKPVRPKKDKEKKPTFLPVE